jgi:SAM-dependent methyltransferase
MISCQICGYSTGDPDPRDLGTARGNTKRFQQTYFRLWKCPRCHTIYNIDPIDFRDIYSDYPLSKRQLDTFARATMRNLLRRLERSGLKKSDSILDYGCGNGVFIRFLREAGYQDVTGYDPYVPEFSGDPADRPCFDCVISNDVIEHCPDAREMIRKCAALVKPGGLLYIGTAESDGVDMRDLAPHLMRLHQPFHRLILSEKTLQKLGPELGLEPVSAYRRSYMDTLIPFANYRFLDELNKALGHVIDLAFDPSAVRRVIFRPKPIFFGLFGFFFPSAYEPAVILRKTESGSPRP